MEDAEHQRTFQYQRYHQGGWYVVNVRYPNGAAGCVSRNYPDQQWRIVCDSRLGDHTYATRDEAARAEQDLITAGVLGQRPLQPTQ